MSKHLAEKTIDLAKEAWVHRNSLIMTDGDQQEAERLLAFHDTLVSLARNFDEEIAPTKDFSKTASKKKRKPAPKKRKPTTLSNRIQSAMAVNKVTADDVVAATGIAAGTFEGILSGETKRPQARTLRKIESALGLEEGDLERDA